MFVNVLLVLVVFSGVADGIICEFCKKDFAVVNRHIWRCPERAVKGDGTIVVARPSGESDQNLFVPASQSVANVNQVINSIEQTNYDPNKQDHGPIHQCYCGREFSSLRGLNIHRRGCHVVDVPCLADMFVPLVDSNTNTMEIQEPEPEKLYSKPTFRTGIKLPTTSEQWERANEFYKTDLTD